MPEPGADPGPPASALPEGGWMREYAETVTQSEPPLADSPPTVLEAMQMQSDTGVARAEAQLGRAEAELVTPGGAVPGGFLIDPERAEAAVAKMEQVVVDLRRAQVDWAMRSWFPAPGGDEVSRNLAANAIRMAGSAEAFVSEYARQVEEATLSLRAQIEAYRRTDRANTAEQA